MYIKNNIDIKIYTNMNMNKSLKIIPKILLISKHDW